ncbi:hypothetical protein KEM55_006407 [Ascosphaera atra]|nr:hypothetical protein KEM55_006407 [Ascosphaera atra]
MDAQNHEEGMGYQIKGRFGNYESFEREYFDMIRAAFLKYSLQVRIGRMDGIFVAFHNIKRIFGFQYFSLPEMDQTIHGQANTSLGHREFKLSLGLWNKILDKATERFPKQSLRFHFETRDSKTPFMYIFAEPVTEEEVDAIQSRNHAEIEEISKKLLGDDEKVEAALQAQADAEREDDSTSSKTLPGEGVNAEEAAGAGSKVVDSGSMEPSNVSDFEPSTAEAKAHSEQTPEATPEQASSEESEPEVDTSRPLFAMLLSIQNKVNGKIVERPQALKPKDKWELNYELRSFTDQERAWQYYNLCKSRRQKELDKKSEEGSSRDDFFTMLLKKLSQSGNSWREKINKIEKDMGIVTLKDRR